MEADISFTPLHRTDEREVKSNSLGQFHLAPATFEALGSHPVTELRLSWITLDGPSHPYSPDTSTSLMLESLTLVLNCERSGHVMMSAVLLNAKVNSRKSNEVDSESTVVRRILCVASVGVAVVVLLLGATAGASKESKAAKLYRHYYNVYLVAASNRGIKEQNSSNAATSTAGINLEIAAINQFDNHIQTIKFPNSDKGALSKVLVDNSVLTSLDRTLAANTSNASNYNSLFPGVQTAQANADAAVNYLAKELGMHW